ncbi:MAG: YbjN domain-containing protein [Spirochaetes bacterium]|nr:YbjN domain-containing protein [Spirochaetota bacterium]
MISRDKIEGYLLKLSLFYENIGDNSWLIRDEEKGLENVVVIAADPLVIVRVNVMDIPENEKRCEVFEKLLRLNASDMIHGAYALEENSIIMIDTLEGETMDIEELQATLDAIGLALIQHYKVLSKYRTKKQ